MRSLSIFLLLSFVVITDVWAQSKKTKLKLANQFLESSKEARRLKDYKASNHYLFTAARYYRELVMYPKFIECRYEAAINHFLNSDYRESVGVCKNTLDSIQVFKVRNRNLQADCYSLLGSSYRAMDQIENALVAFEDCERFLIVATKSIDERNLRVYEDIADCNIKLKRISRAAEYTKRIINYSTVQYGKVHIRTARTLYALAEIYLKNSNFEQALGYYEKSFVMHEKLKFKSKEDYIDVLNKIAYCHAQMGKFKLSLEYYGRADKAVIKHFGERHPKSAVVRTNIANAYFQYGDYDNALYNCLEALKLKEKLFGKQTAVTAYALNVAANVYQALGVLDQALAFYQEALEIRIKLHGNKHAEVANSYQHLGTIYRDKGLYDLALKYLDDALFLRKNIYGESHPSIALCYQYIGSTYLLKNAYEVSLEYLQKALIIRKNYYGEKNPVIATSYMSLGEVYESKKEYNTALDYYKKALEIRIGLLGNNNIETAKTYQSIGNVYKRMKIYELALEYLNKALNIDKKFYGEYHPNVASGLQSVAEVFVINNNFDSALVYHNNALKTYQILFGENHPKVSTSYNEIGNLYIKMKESSKGLEMYQKALISNTSNFNKINITANPPLFKYYDANVLLNTLIFKGKAFQDIYINYSKDLKDLQVAYQTFALADTLSQIIALSMEKVSDKIFLSEKEKKINEGLVECATYFYKTTRDESYIDKAFYYCEKSKSKILLSALSDIETKKLAKISKEDLSKEKELKNKIEECKRNIAIRAENISMEDSWNILFKSNEDLKEHLFSYKLKYPIYSQLKKELNFIKLDSLNLLLDDETASLNYFIGESSVYIIMLSKGRKEIIVKKKNDFFDYHVEGLRQGIVFDAQKGYIESAFSLYNQLIPSELDKSIKNLLIIPDGKLTTIPFEALLTSNVKMKDYNSYDKYPYLIKDYKISYSYSATLFAQTQSRKTTKTPKGLLAFAPIFEKTKEDTLLLATNVSSNSVSNNSFFSTLQVLPYSEEEVNFVKKLFDKKKYASKLYLANNATKENFISESLKDYRYIHLATHGFTNEDKPELSGVAFFKEKNTQSDFILYQGEIYNLDLRADLVALSACETGLGKISSGEGVLGLSRALFYTGCKNMLVSLWKVTDESTSILMSNFYKSLLTKGSLTSNLLNNNPVHRDALHKAKLQMLKNKTLANPHNWAGFIILGQ